LMPGRTGFPENDGQYLKQAANDNEWRMAA